jgi:hypothetical protein
LANKTSSHSCIIFYLTANYNKNDTKLVTGKHITENKNQQQQPNNNMTTNWHYLVPFD